jgi:hypothetical protein
MFRRIALIGISLLTLMNPAFAATKSEVLAACTSTVASVAATCQTKLAAYIAQVKSAGVNVDATLGALVYELVLSPNLSAAVKDVVGGAIETIAANVSDTKLKGSLSSVASDVKDDGVVATPPTKAYSPGAPSGN